MKQLGVPASEADEEKRLAGVRHEETYLTRDHRTEDTLESMLAERHDYFRAHMYDLTSCSRSVTRDLS